MSASLVGSEMCIRDSGNMSTEDINKVHAVITKWKNHLRKDTAIKAIAEVVGAFPRVQDSMDLQSARPTTVLSCWSGFEPFLAPRTVAFPNPESHFPKIRKIGFRCFLLANTAESHFHKIRKVTFPNPENRFPKSG
eukprot:5345644-Alexandrium_andersonii.AAC.1